jgi:hypothetical protein
MAMTSMYGYDLASARRFANSASLHWLQLLQGLSPNGLIPSSCSDRRPGPLLTRPRCRHLLRIQYQPAEFAWSHEPVIGVLALLQYIAIVTTGHRGHRGPQRLALGTRRNSFVVPELYI